MRLIDADKLILHLNDYALLESPTDKESVEERRLSEMVYRVIQNCIKAVEEQPTAYDVDAVVAELEEERAIYKMLCSTCKEEIIVQYELGRCQGILKATEIVRKGGVE